MNAGDPTSSVSPDGAGSSVTSQGGEAGKSSPPGQVSSSGSMQKGAELSARDKTVTFAVNTMMWSQGAMSQSSASVSECADIHRQRGSSGVGKDQYSKNFGSILSGPVGRGRTLRNVSDYNSTVRPSASLATGGDALSEPQVARDQKNAKRPEDYNDEELSQMCQTGITTTSAKKNMATFEESDKSFIHATPEKEAGGVCNASNDQARRSSAGTPDRTRTQTGNPNQDSFRTPDMPGNSLVTKEHVQEPPKKIFVSFSTIGKEPKLIPLTIDVAKLNLLQNSGLRDKIVQLSPNKADTIWTEFPYGILVTNTREMQDNEATSWEEECRRTVLEMLQSIQTVRFCGIDVLPYLRSVKGKDLHFTSDSDGKWLTVFTTSSEAMDQFFKTEMPVLQGERALKMLIEIPFNRHTFLKLEHLGFKNHYVQKMPDVKMLVNYDGNRYILDCHTDLRHSFHSEVKAFLNNLESVSFDVTDLYKRILLKSNFQHTFVKHGLCCWCTENKGLVQVLSPSKDVLSKVENIVFQRMVGYTICLQPSHDRQHCLTIFDHHQQESEMFGFQERADGTGIEIAGLKDCVHRLIRELQLTSVSQLQVCVRTDMGNKGPGQQDRCGNTGRTLGEAEQSPGTVCTKLEQHGSKDRSATQGDRSGSEDNLPGESEQHGSKDRSATQGDRSGSEDNLPGESEQHGSKDRSATQGDRSGSEDNLPGESEQHGSKDRSATQGDRSGSEDNPPGESEQCGGKDQSSVRQSDRTDDPSIGQEHSTCTKDPKHQERSVTDKSQAEQDRSDSLNTERGHPDSQSGHPGAQSGHPGAQPRHSGAQSGHPGTQQPVYPGTQQPGPGSQDKAPDRNAQQSETASPVQQPDQTIPESGRRQEHGAHIIYPIPEEIVQLLEVDAVCDRFKSKLMDKSCLINIQSLSECFVTITKGCEKDVSGTLDELFHREEIEVGEDDPDLEQALQSFCKGHAGKVGCVFGRGWCKVCTTADTKDEICIELETLKRSECFVPLPLFAHEFLALKIGKVDSHMKQHVDNSVTASIHKENQGILLSAERKFMKHAVQWLNDFVLNLEVTEKTVTVDKALFLQDLRGQEMIQRMEDTHYCRIDAVPENGNCGLRATGPSDQQLIVCGDTMAATDCDCIVLPLCDGQAEWSSLQRWILRSSLLSEDTASYQSLCRDRPVNLQGNADFAGKTIIIVSVPAEVDMGANKEKERITEAYKEVFARCRYRSVAVCAKQSPKIPLHKSLKPLLVAVWGTAKSPSPCCCQTVVIYADSAQDSNVACQTVTEGCPQEWHLKPERVSRPQSGKGTIEVCIGEIQKVEADVIVNSTNIGLKPNKGAVEKVIARAAGQDMITDCQRLYPNGIPLNGLAVTDSFRMKNAKKIYHIALSTDPFQEDTREVLLHDLRRVILRCLVKASMEQHSSIAFPTLGSGQLRYPCDAVARVMFSTINNFFTEMPHTTLQTVSIVVYQENDEAIQALKMEEISQLYTFSSEQEETVQKCEMQLEFKTHRVQIVHGDVYSKPWVTDACIHGQIPSDRGESASSAGGCQSVIVKPGKVSRHDYKHYLRKAFQHGRTIQIAADTWSSEPLEDLASALETVLEERTMHRSFLVSVIFSDEKKIHMFMSSFSKMDSGHGEAQKDKESQGQVFMCSYKKAEEVIHEIEKFKVPDRYEKLMNSYRKTIADEKRNKADAGRGDKVQDQNEAQDDQKSNQIQVSIPNNLLKKVDLSKIMGFQSGNVGKRTTTAFVKLEDFVNTAVELHEHIGNRPSEQQAEEKKKTPGAEADSSAGWSKDVDQLAVEALRFLLGAEFDQTLDVQENQGCYLLTFKGAPSKALENQVDSLRQEDVQLTPEEISKLGDTVDVKSEGIEAFVKTVPSHGKAAVFAFDYNAMTKAKHLVTVKAGRVKVTSRARRRFDTGTPGQVDQTPAQSVDVPGHGGGSIMQTANFTTPSGVKVSVYKTDITKLPVDAIVNAANEQLAHGGGVAYAISKAAGFALEDEGRQHLSKHGPLQVTEVVETTAGALPCKKVLHAVGPRWGDYTDKALCGQHLVDTVFNCLQKADSLGFTSIALPSISAAIFGVPQDLCAVSYLSAVKRFDERHGHSTSVRHVHFVDVNDAMISTIHSIFTAQWSAPASNTADSQAGHTTAAHGATQQETTSPSQSLAEGVPQRPWDIPPTSEASQIPQKNPLAPSPTSEPHRITQRPLDMNTSTETHQDMKTGVQGQTTSSMALSLQEPVGFPSMREVVVDKERQVHIGFKDLNLTLILQGKSVVDMETKSVILWQDVQNIMKNSIWRQFKKRLSAQVTNKAEELKKDMSTVGKVVCLDTENKQFVFIVLSFNTSYDEDRITEFVEKALNKVDLAQKTTVAITRISKQNEKASNKNREDLEIFMKGLYRAVKNYGQRATRTIREIHIAETKPGILQSMVGIMETLVVMDRSLQDQAPSRLSSVPAGPLSHPSQSPDPCAVCKDKPSDPKPLSCGHVFCKHCIDHWFQSKPTCPVCNAIHGNISGDQPEDGRMKMTFSSNRRCEGFPQGMYTVEYSFPSGTQKENHPNPGRWYIGTDRKAYLPDTPEGKKVLMLLKVAFDRRLIFTIGPSATTGDVGIVWNDIHHKTRTVGGSESYGYPDPDYLDRVLAELAIKGVTEKDLTDTHRDFIDNSSKFCGGFFSSRDFSHHFKA